MASVPSAGCLLAKNQFYRARLNSESSVSSSSSDTGLSIDVEKTHQGLPEMVEKCWWLKNFFHCEQVPTSSIRINTSADRNHS
ncbi:pancreatic progenitor cell differentiation and proliferation factor-like protein [Discoglossus pictus]